MLWRVRLLVYERKWQPEVCLLLQASKMRARQDTSHTWPWQTLKIDFFGVSVSWACEILRSSDFEKNCNKVVQKLSGCNKASKILLYRQGSTKPDWSVRRAFLPREADPPTWSEGFRTTLLESTSWSSTFTCTSWNILYIVNRISCVLNKNERKRRASFRSKKNTKQRRK